MFISTYTLFITDSPHNCSVVSRPRHQHLATPPNTCNTTSYILDPPQTIHSSSVATEALNRPLKLQIPLSNFKHTMLEILRMIYYFGWVDDYVAARAIRYYAIASPGDVSWASVAARAEVLQRSSEVQVHRWYQLTSCTIIILLLLKRNHRTV